MPPRRRVVPLRTPPEVSFQQALLTLLDAQPETFETVDGLRQVQRLILVHMNELNDEQSPRTTLGMVYDTAQAAKLIRAGGKSAAEAKATDLTAIFGRLSPRVRAMAEEAPSER